MNVLHGLDGLRSVPQGAVLSIGNFDGIHLGHLKLLDTCRAIASSTPTARNVVAVTFEPHPMTVLHPKIAPPRLTPEMVKDRLLAAAGVEHLVVLPPTPDVLNLSAEAFWAILRKDVQASHLVEGSNFTFGKDRRGNVERLREWAADAQIGVTIVDAVQAALLDLTLVEVSSTLIRWLLGYGRVRDASICLGRPYTLRGTVVKGFQRGRTIGVPTANLQLEDQLAPDDGVYVGRCAINGQTYPAAVSIGTLPTFAENFRQIEAHLVGFSGDLYDRVIEIDLLDWLRDQRKFNGVDALKAQIQRDLADVVARQWIMPMRSVATAVG